MAPSYFRIVSALASILLPACGDAGPTVPPVPPAKAAVSAPAEPAPPPTRPVRPSVVLPAAPGRVVAVGDLHGDLQNALATLRLAGVVDAEGQWAGGNTVFVQTGDITDRGPDSRALIQLMARLSTQAPQAGGRVLSLLGNHETMNLTGDLRYVHPGDFEAFGGPAARAEALSARGVEGAWLREQAAVAQVGDTVFVHGGVSTGWSSHGVDGLNRLVDAALQGGDDAVIGQSGPLWYRDYVQLPEPAACPALAQALHTLGARRMVVGHTTRRDGRIEVRCAGALAVIDIGIAAHYGGHLGAWELTGGDSRALYPSGAVDLPDPPAN